MKSLSAALLVGLLSACSSTGDVPVASRTKDAGASALVYSFVDERGRIRMASRIEDIPAEQRDRIVATDTARPRTERIKTDRVVVVDLREDGAGRQLNYSLVDLDALGKSSPGPQPRTPGELGRWSVGRLTKRLGDALGLAPAASPDQVILYTAPWCGFCKKAAAYLKNRGTAFVERDIDNDRSAAVELSRKLREAGLSGGGIPVLDIDGTLVIGFNQARIDALLDD